MFKVNDKVKLANGMVVRIAEMVDSDTAIVFGDYNYSAVTSLIGASKPNVKDI